MKKTSNGSSLLVNVIRIFRNKPIRNSMKLAQQANARVQPINDKKPSPRVHYPYRAAEIVVEDCACAAVKAMTGERFLMRDIPHIPLPGCTSRKCACRYVRYLDRRSQQGDRRAIYSVRTNAYKNTGSTERRERRDRRAIEMAASQQ